MKTKLKIISWSLFNLSEEHWDNYLTTKVRSGFHQSYAWGEYRRKCGWTPYRLMACDESKKPKALVQILLRRKFGIVICWIPGIHKNNIIYLDNKFKKYLKHIAKSPFIYTRINLLDESSNEGEINLKRLGWSRVINKINSGLSMGLDLTIDSREQLQRLSKNWRHNLKRSKKYDLLIERWISIKPVEMYSIYEEMESIKGINQQFSLANLEEIIPLLAKQLIMYRCFNSNGKVIAFRGAVLFGNIGMDLFAAATTEARKVYASYALLWAVIEDCQNNGIVHYDLAGVNPDDNLGVYNFKKGTGAKLIRYLGEWDWANVPLLRYFINKAILYSGIKA